MPRLRPCPSQSRQGGYGGRQLWVAGILNANATDMYAKNVLNLVGDMCDKEKGFHYDFEDEVVVGSVVCHQGEICHARVREAHGMSPLTQPQEA